MSLSDRRALLRGLGAGFGAVLLLPGCLRPMLAEGGAATALRGRIDLPSINGRVGYHLYKRLEDRLGTPVRPDYRLDVALTFRDRGLAISQDDAVTRITMTAEADWALYAKGTTEPLLRDRAMTQSGYNATGSLFAARQTRRDIERRLARDLGDRISRVLLARADMVLAKS